MSVSIGMAAGASAQAAAALQQAREAKKIACQNSMPSFNDQKATIEQKQIYADCVGFLYPQELDPAQILVMKALFVLALIGGCVGVYKGKTERYAFDIVIYGLLGFLCFPIAAAGVCGLVAGVLWLFS